MLPVFSRFKFVLLAGACVLGLMGCAGSPRPGLQGLPERVELTGLLFFRGDAYQGGPQVLASMISQQGIVITPGLLLKSLHLPGAEAQLEQNLQVAARDFGMVVYPLDNTLAQVLTQVAAGYPVMVRITEGSAFWAEPRYAIVAGYNRHKQTILLRSGMNRRLVMGFGSFESAWDSAGHWAILVQGPTQIPAKVDSQRWLKAAADLAQAGQEQAAARAVKALGAH